ncbi:TPA: biotin transporter BioY [Candidatus Scatousia excrementigallinarum]|uniref:Biotin transporter BioY n=1 Tax=Candidatus Scatousia excrementigallinarum TaxID=2840935 RepID=A0A9D1EWB3_9BACT|nr:biotin transporter BioY [Candidatus Scatousia excrementigallinarum]
MTQEEQAEQQQPKKKLRVKTVKPKKRKGIRLGVGSLVLLVFCSFLLVISTFLQLDITHFIIPSKLFSGEPTKLGDYLFTYKFIPQIPAVMFIVGLLGRRLGITSILLYIITGLFFLPVFALGGGWRYIFEYGFGYILAYVPAAFFAGLILKKGYSYKNTAKAVFTGVMTIHILGILYMMCLAALRHTGWGFVGDWIVAQSGLKIIYDFIFSYILVLAAKYLRIILWLYL